MKVLENLENYEVPPQFRLTSAEEEELAKDLASIINDLIPIRTSKLKTRQYFNSHLRFSSNEKDFKASIQEDDLPFPPSEEYKALPGEYLWNSDLLQPTLLDIIKPCEYQFGYVYNLIQEDIAYRKNQRVMKGVRISDGLVKFSNQFDIDEIRKTAKEIKDLPERILYLNKIHTDYMVFDELSQDEENWVGSEIYRAIEALQAEAEKEFSVFQQTGGTKHRDHTNTDKKLETGAHRADKYDAAKGMLYDFAVSQKEVFKPLAIVLPDKWDKSVSRNIKAFTSFIDYYFETCFDDNHGLTENEATFRLTPQLLGSMMDSYMSGLRAEQTIADRVIMKRITQWVFQTHKILDKGYENHPVIYSDEEPFMTADGPEVPQASTFGFKKKLLSTVYGYLPYLLEDYAPLMPDSLTDEVPYNVWRNEYQDLKEKYSNQFGLEFRKRAVIRVEDNVELYRQILEDNCIRYCNQRNSEQSFGATISAEESTTSTFIELFHSLFRDYLKRISTVSGNKDDIDSALLCWIFNLESLLHSTYENDHTSIESKTSCKYPAANYCHEFFYDICSKIVIELAIGYFDDFERMDLVPEKINVVAEPAINSDTKNDDAPNIDEEEQNNTLAHSKQIDFTQLYNEWKGKAFTNTSIDEFTDAINYADFKTMLQKATDAGLKSGYIGGVKYIMKSLKSVLGSQWYDIACSSINETPNSIDKLNLWTGKIKTIDVSIIKECIK